MARKTINVDTLRMKCNTALAHESDYMTRDMRFGIASVLEMALMETGNYHGFRYLTASELPNGATPGIDYIGGPTGDPIFPDDSRRHYS